MIAVVTRWSMIAMAIIIAGCIMVILAIRVDNAALHGQVTILEQSNQTMADAAKANAKAVIDKSKDDEGNVQIIKQKREKTAEARAKARDDEYAIRQSISTEACAAVRLPSAAISLLKSPSGDRGEDYPSASTSGSDTRMPGTSATW